MIIHENEDLDNNAESIKTHTLRDSHKDEDNEIEERKDNNNFDSSKNADLQNLSSDTMSTIEYVKDILIDYTFDLVNIIILDLALINIFLWGDYFNNILLIILSITLSDILTQAFLLALAKCRGKNLNQNQNKKKFKKIASIVLLKLLKNCSVIITLVKIIKILTFLDMDIFR